LTNWGNVFDRWRGNVRTPCTDTKKRDVGQAGRKHGVYGTENTAKYPLTEHQGNKDERHYNKAAGQVSSAQACYKKVQNWAMHVAQ